LPFAFTFACLLRLRLVARTTCDCLLFCCVVVLLCCLPAFTVRYLMLRAPFALPAFVRLRLLPRFTLFPFAVAVVVGCVYLFVLITVVVTVLFDLCLLRCCCLLRTAFTFRWYVCLHCWCCLRCCFTFVFVLVVTRYVGRCC